LNQDHEDRDGAAALAAAVATAFIPEITVADVIKSMFEHSSFVVKRSLELTMDMAYASQTVDEFAEKFYATMLDWKWPLPRDQWNKERTVSGSSLEIVPVVAALLYLCQGDVNQCIIEGAGFGRDCDTISNIVGEIAGAMQGASAIRSNWIEESEKANVAFFEELEGDPKANFHSMAERLDDALQKEQQAVQKRVEMLKGILSS
jgi:ADP-ribosylglycohydrolase